MCSLCVCCSLATLHEGTCCWVDGRLKKTRSSHFISRASSLFIFGGGMEGSKVVQHPLSAGSDASCRVTVILLWADCCRTRRDYWHLTMHEWCSARSKACVRTLCCQRIPYHLHEPCSSPPNSGFNSALTHCSDLCALSLLQK